MSNAIRCETKRGRWRAQRWELYRGLGHQEACPRRTAEVCGSTTTVSNSGRFPDRLHLAHPRKVPPRTRNDHRPNFSSHAARTPRWSCGRRWELSMGNRESWSSVLYPGGEDGIPHHEPAPEITEGLQRTLIWYMQPSRGRSPGDSAGCCDPVALGSVDFRPAVADALTVASLLGYGEDEPAAGAHRQRMREH
jgi:hypothetical protein